MHTNRTSGIMAYAIVAMLSTHSLAAGADYDVKRTALLPEAIASFGGAVHGDYLYVIGGHIGKAHDHSRANLTGAFRRLDLRDGESWETLPGDVPLQSVSLVAHGDHLYRVGGLTAANATTDDAEELHSSDQVARYNPATQEWNTLPALPHARSSHDTVILGDRMYVLGGWTLSGKPRDGDWLTTGHVMDLSSESLRWEPLPESPFKRRAVAVAALNTKIYVLGGISEFGSPSQEVDVLDLKTGEWTEGPELPDNGFGLSAFAVGGHVYASGLSGAVWRLDEEKDKWDTVSHLTFARFFHRLLPAGDGRLAIVGGAAGGGHLRHIEFVDLKDQTPDRPTLTMWTLPYPGDAHNRQGVFLHQNNLYVFGGNNSREQHDFEPENFLSQGFQISLGSFEVTPVADFPLNRQSMLTIMPGERPKHGYTVGGFAHDGDVARSHDDVYRYDFKDNEWTKLDVTLPQPRTQFELVEHDESLWIFGGLDYDPRRERADRFRHVTDVLRWKLDSDEKTFQTTEYELRQPRRAFAGAKLGDHFYLVGGMRENFNLVEQCDVFNFKTGQWEDMPSPAQRRLSATLIPIDDKLYLVGGASPDKDDDIVPNQSIEVYDPKQKRWATLIEELPFEPKHTHIMAWNGQLLLYSAQMDDDHTIRIAVIAPTADRSYHGGAGHAMRHGRR